MMSTYLPTVFGENLMDVFDDFDRSLHIVKLPKTKASVRTIPLADKLLEHLTPFEGEKNHCILY